jgi:hypothetical protein
MYVPLDLWHSLLDSPEAVGPKGGVVITWDNCVRRFNNGEFTNLLRQGRIGSASGESKALSKSLKRFCPAGACWCWPRQPQTGYRRICDGIISGDSPLKTMLHRPSDRGC